MQIKRQDLEALVSALEAAAPFRNVYRDDHKAAIVLGRKLLKPLPDPVDVVPVQDYPFKLPDAVKPYGEGPT